MRGERAKSDERRDSRLDVALVGGNVTADRDRYNQPTMASHDRCERKIAQWPFLH